MMEYLTGILTSVALYSVNITVEQVDVEAAEIVFQGSIDSVIMKLASICAWNKPVPKLFVKWRFSKIFSLDIGQWGGTAQYDHT